MKHILDVMEGRGTLGDYRKRFEDSDGYKRVDASIGDIKSELNQRLGYRMAGMNATGLAQLLASGQFSDMARRYGMNDKQFGYAVASKMYGSDKIEGIARGWMSPELMFDAEQLGAGLEKEMAPGDILDKYFRESRWSGDLFSNASFNNLQNFGISGADVSEWQNSPTGGNIMDDYSNFSKALAAKAYGGDYGQYAKGVRSKGMKTRLMELLKKDAGELKGMFGESWWKPDQFNQDTAAQYLQQNLLGGASQVNFENMTRVAQDIWGFGSDQTDMFMQAAGSRDINKIADFLMGQEKPSQVVASMQDSIRNIRGIGARAGDMLSEDDRRKMAAQAGIDFNQLSTDPRKAMEQAINAAIASTTYKEESKVKEQEKKEKTLDRVMVKMTGGGEADYAIQVVDASKTGAKPVTDKQQDKNSNSTLAPAGTYGRSNPYAKSGPGTMTGFGSTPGVAGSYFGI
jgi:hypothetical protein